MGTSTLTNKDLVTCPKCGKDVWDNRLTKKGKQPDYRCRDRSCDGAIWLPKPKPGTPPFLHNAAAEDAAELAGKIGPADDARDKALLGERSIYAVRMRQAYAYVLDDIEPLCRQKEIGLTGDDIYKTAFSLWKSWIDAGIMK